MKFLMLKFILITFMCAILKPIHALDFSSAFNDDLLRKLLNRAIEPGNIDQKIKYLKQYKITPRELESVQDYTNFVTTH